MIDIVQAAAQTVTQAVTAAGAQATTDRAALLEGIHRLTDVVGQLVQLGAHVTTGGATVYAIEVLKRQPWFLKIWTLYGPKWKLFIAAIAAAIPAAGIAVTFQHTDPGDYILHIQNLTGVTFWKFLWSLAQGLTMQQAFYDGAVRPRSVAGTTSQNQPPVLVTPVPQT